MDPGEITLLESEPEPSFSATRRANGVRYQGCWLGLTPPMGLPPRQFLAAPAGGRLCRQLERHSKTMTFERQSLLTPELPNITRLVPLERHLSATRWQFIRGVLIGILVSCAVAIPAFKYANIRQHGASLQNTSGQTPLGNSDAPAASPALKSTSDIVGTSFLPPTLPKPQPSKPSNDSPVNQVQPLLAQPRPQFPLTSA